MAFDNTNKAKLTLLNHMRAQDFPKKYLKWHQGNRKKNGWEPIVYNYDFGFQHDFLRVFFDRMQELGFSRRSTLSIVYARTNLRPSELFRISEGLLSLKAWQVGILADVAEISIRMFGKRQNYTYRSEGRNEDLLTLQSFAPKFTVTFSKEDLLDFSADFGNDEHLRYCETKRYGSKFYFGFVWEICQWYFLQKARRDKMPFSKTLFEQMFTEKWKRNETNHLRNNRRKVPAEMTISEDDIMDYDPSEDQDRIQSNYMADFRELFASLYNRYTNDDEVEILPAAHHEDDEKETDYLES